MANVAAQILSAERIARVVAWRSEGETFPEIGARLNVSPQRAHQIWAKALADIPAAKLHEYRQNELAMCDTATRELLAIARDTSVSPRTRIEAWQALRAWREPVAKMLGLYAPTRKEVTVLTDDAISESIRKLTVEMEQIEAQAAADGVVLAEATS